MCEDPFKEIIRVGELDNWYLGLYRHTSRETKAMIERQIVMEWAGRMRDQRNIQVSNVVSCESDPPDCSALMDGEVIGIEVVLFVDQNSVKRAIKGESPYKGQLMLDGFWDKDRFVSRLSEIIEKKVSALSKARKIADVLLIQVVEHWLFASDVREWLLQHPFPALRGVEAVVMQFPYDPSEPSDPRPLVQVW